MRACGMHGRVAAVQGAPSSPLMGYKKNGAADCHPVPHSLVVPKRAAGFGPSSPCLAALDDARQARK